MGTGESVSSAEWGKASGSRVLAGREVVISPAVGIYPMRRECGEQRKFEGSCPLCAQEPCADGTDSRRMTSSGTSRNLKKQSVKHRKN